jgi:hypothetical protein
MKMQFTPILLSLLSSSSILADPPKVPKAESVYTAFLASEIYGPSKQSNSIYKNVSSLVKDLHKGKYLGVDLEYDSVKWRGSDNYFHQYWTIVLDKDSGMRVCVFEQVSGKVKKRYCHLSYYFSANSVKNTGSIKSYYYQLPSKIEKSDR